MNPSPEPAFPAFAQHSNARALWAGAVLGLLLLGFVVLGHDGRRVGQLMALAAIAPLWLLWPLQKAWTHRLRTATVLLWTFAFMADGVVRAYLLDAYQAAPDGALVLAAAANTNARESAEYLAMHWRSMVSWLAVLGVAAPIVVRCAQRGARPWHADPAAGESAAHARPRPSRWLVGLTCLVLLAAGIGHASKPWRRLHPVVFWSTWTQSVHALQAGWVDHQQAREQSHRSAAALAPAVGRAGPSTVVLVITDSINRDNLGLYGYDRATTPRLLAQKAQLGDAMLVLRHAWSADASTLPALRNMFRFGRPDAEAPPHALALARAAGYKIWWISNHDDVAIEQQHARMADVVDMVNRTPGRASASLDGELLDGVQEALRDSSPRKLVVVHLMGAHPHYSLRFPPGANHFDNSTDMVEVGLEKQGRSAWVRRSREAYDAALRYQDSVVSELLQMTRDAGKPDEYRAWMYLSDHGQEVGHGSNRAGHSPATASGYRIPAIIWREPALAPLRQGVAEQPFRADWSAWALADLLDIRWTGHETARNVLHDDYRWLPPDIPVAAVAFRQ